MSTMLLTAPLAPRRLSAPRVSRLRVATAPASSPRPPLRSARLQQGPAALPPVATSRRVAVRLTARGRAVFLGLLVVLGLAASLLTASVSGAGTSSTPVPVQYVTVAPGQTLWAIAAEVAPSADRRDTIAQILELNALSGSSVQAGQRIAVPVTP